MTIRVNEWYRVKATRQYCVVQKIPSTTNPSVSVPTANENTRGFELALTWYAPTDEAPQKWTKRAMIMEIRKALGILREPNEDDQPIIARIKSISASLPVSSASRDGEFTIGGTT
jgi:hypothetical protein